MREDGWEACLVGFFFLFIFFLFRAHLTFSLLLFIVFIYFCHSRSCSFFYFFILFYHLFWMHFSIISIKQIQEKTTFFQSSHLSIPFLIFYPLIFFTLPIKWAHYINLFFFFFCFGKHINLSLLARFWKLFHSSTLRNMGYMFLCIKLL